VTSASTNEKRRNENPLVLGPDLDPPEDGISCRHTEV